jgi:predicted ArsR family transcriptional regulator
MTRAEIAEAIGVNPITLVKHLNNLMERGALKRVREGMTYYYFLSHADIPKKKKRRNEDNYEMKPYVNPIRQRALDDLEKLKKMKQK